MRGLRRAPLQLGLIAVLMTACANPRGGASTPVPLSDRQTDVPSAALGAPPASAIASGASSSSRQAFHLGYPNLSLSYLPILMARDLGYYEQEGLDADVSLMRANVGQAALIAGEIEFTASIGSNIKMAL